MEMDFKKKLLIGLVAGTAVFAAVFGSAATLGGLTTESLGAQGTDVTACDSDGVSTSYTVAYSTTGYNVSKVLISGLDDACAGKSVSVTLSDTTNAVLGTQAATMSSWTATATDANTYELTLSSPVSAAAVEGIDVLIKG
jgi:hypothetical protein